MPNLPDEVQREFEVRPGHQMLSLCVVRDDQVVLLDTPAAKHVRKVVEKWLWRMATVKPGEARCLTCATDFFRLTHAPKAFVVGLPTAKMHRRGKIGALVVGVCARCCAQGDDALIEIARKQWAPKATPVAEGNA